MVTEPQERIGIYLCDRIKRANGPTAEALLENSLAVAEVGARSGAALPQGAPHPLAARPSDICKWQRW